MRSEMEVETNIQIPSRPIHKLSQKVFNPIKDPTTTTKTPKTANTLKPANTTKQTKTSKPTRTFLPFLK